MRLLCVCVTTRGNARTLFWLQARISNVSARGKHAKQTMWSYFKCFFCFFFTSLFRRFLPTLALLPFRFRLQASCKAAVPAGRARCAGSSSACQRLRLQAAADGRLLFTGRLRNNSRPSASGQSSGRNGSDCLRVKILEISENQTGENFKGALVRESGFIFLNLFFSKDWFYGEVK